VFLARYVLRRGNVSHLQSRRGDAIIGSSR